MSDLEEQILKDLYGAGYGAAVRRRDIEKLLSISKEQALALLRSGEIASTHHGKEYRIPLRSVAGFIDKSCRPPRPGA